MLTSFVLNGTLSCGALVLGNPLLFGSLLSFHYPDKAVAARAGEPDRAQATSNSHLADNVESLAAHRRRKHAALASAGQSEAA